MGGKNKKHIKTPPVIPNNQEEYNLKNNFNRLHQYRSSNNYQTQVDKGQSINNLSTTNNYAQDAGYYNTPTLGDTYFRLEGKITALSDKNDAAHDSLRKELERKIEKAKTEVKNDIKDLKEDDKQQFKDIKDERRWRIGIIIAIVAAVIGYFIYPYQKINNNKEEIIKIRTTIDDYFKPSIDNIFKTIEKHEAEINANSNNIIILQNQIQTQEEKNKNMIKNKK